MSSIDDERIEFRCSNCAREYTFSDYINLPMTPNGNTRNRPCECGHQFGDDQNLLISNVDALDVRLEVHTRFLEEVPHTCPEDCRYETDVLLDRSSNDHLPERFVDRLNVFFSKFHQTRHDALSYHERLLNLFRMRQRELKFEVSSYYTGPPEHWWDEFPHWNGPEIRDHSRGVEYKCGKCGHEYTKGEYRKLILRSERNGHDSTRCRCGYGFVKDTWEVVEEIPVAIVDEFAALMVGKIDRGLQIADSDLRTVTVTTRFSDVRQYNLGYPIGAEYETILTDGDFEHYYATIEEAMDGHARIVRMVRERSGEMKPTPILRNLIISENWKDDGRATYP